MRAFFLGLAIVVGACSGSASTLAAERATTSASDPTVPSDALSQMEIAFIGNPRQAVIKQKVEDVLALYDLEATEENYRHVGDALVALRQGEL